MLILDFNELTKEDIEKYTQGYDEKILRFCIDIKHNKLVLCAPKEDHVFGSFQLLEIEGFQNSEVPESFAAEVQNHIVGCSMIIENNNARVIVGGSSNELALKMQGLLHSKESLEKAEILIIGTFAKVTGNKITVKKKQ